VKDWTREVGGRWNYIRRHLSRALELQKGPGRGTGTRVNATCSRKGGGEGKGLGGHNEEKGKARNENQNVVAAAETRLHKGGVTAEIIGEDPVRVNHRASFATWAAKPRKMGRGE